MHSLVARVMEGVGTPDLVVGPGASPHGYALRPSQAGALQAADLVVWVGPGLTPWLASALPKLAPDATVLTLSEEPTTRNLPLRDHAAFALGDEDSAENGHDHDHDHAHEHDHDHGAMGGFDPHSWLDPENAQAWVSVIAAQLEQIDPENAALYAANAKDARAELAALEDEITEQLSPVQGRPYIVFHDGYQYFETRFNVPAAGAIALSDASDPSPARIAEIRQTVRDNHIECVFSEPQFNSGLVETVFEGTDARTAVVDPLGVRHAPGPDLYPAVLRDLSAALTHCLR